MKKMAVLFIVIMFIAGCSNQSSSVISKEDFKINADGHLIFKGEDLGIVTGNDGTDGKDGINGIDGIDGKDGINGKPGAAGKDGLDGINGTNGIIGVNGKDSLEGIIHQYVDLSKYNVGDQLPFDAGVVPFDWKIDENTTIRVNAISFTLKGKYSLDESKLDFSKRLYDHYYPYQVEIKVTGNAPIIFVKDHYLTISFRDNYRAYSGGGDIKSDGNFELVNTIGIEDYFGAMLTNIELYDCEGTCENDQ